MAKLNYANGVTSVILRVKIMDSTSTTGGAKTGLTFSSSGLIISTIADNEASATAYTAAGSTIETITTLGTFAAPTATKCRFKEVDATNHAGLYEIQIADARWAVSNARSVIVSVSGATGAAQVDAELQLENIPSDMKKWLGVVPNALVSGRNDSIVGAYASNQDPFTLMLAGTFTTIPAAHTVSGAATVALTYKQWQALWDGVNCGDYVVVTPPSASGTATIDYYLQGSDHTVSSNKVATATVVYDSNTIPTSRTLKVVNTFPAIP